MATKFDIEKQDIGSLERTRESLYNPDARARGRTPFSSAGGRSVPHSWGEENSLPSLSRLGPRRVHSAGKFLSFAFVFFLLSLSVAGYLFYFGGNSVSTDKISIDVQGPTTVAGGDTVPLSITITNKNPTSIANATIEIDFPDGTRSAANVMTAYPRYVENLGTLASGETVTRSVKAVIFGGAGQTLTLPVSLSYGTASSNAIFQKTSSYPLAISSTPLSVSVDALNETVSGEPITFSLTVRSNATVPLNNVILSTNSPFGFAVTSSSVPMTNSTFLIGTLAPGASKQVTLTGTLTGQDKEQRVFHFTVGTAKSVKDTALAVTYMTQDASVTIAAPFIVTTLALNGDTSPNAVVAPGGLQSVSLAYRNTLATIVSNVTVTVSVTGSAIDYDSINTTSGFYDSSTHTITFSPQTDPALAALAPAASGIGSFTFTTVPSGSQSPSVSFAVSVSGTRIGQSNVPEQVTTSSVKVAKVATTVLLSSVASHASSLIPSSGSLPPRSNQPMTYTIIWTAQNKGSAVAGGTVSAALPGYVTYTGQTAGSGTFSYNDVSHVVTWTIGDLAQGASAQGAFQLGFTPSTSQRGAAAVLVGDATFAGYDRFAGVQVSAGADKATTETPGDPGYVSGNGIVQ